VAALFDIPPLTSETERRLGAPFRSWPERLIYIERPDAIVTQIAVTGYRPAFLVRAVAQKAAIGPEEVSYHWLLRTFSAGVSCDPPDECALFGTGAARMAVAAKAVRPIIVATITRISALSLTGERVGANLA
jgi:hypothetical protein